MLSSQQLRAKIEKELSNKIPSALTPVNQGEKPTIPCGILELDTLLNGGFPLGAISELSGPHSSGHTTIALSLAANVTQSGSVCAWIDVSDALDPASAVANQVELQRMLWVRCGLDPADDDPSVSDLPSERKTGKHPASENSHGVHDGHHPRNEDRGLDKAVSAFLGSAYLSNKQSLGTPGAPNIPLTKVTRHEQVASDRLPPRRGKNVQVNHPQPSRIQALIKSTFPNIHAKRSNGNGPSWMALDQSLRVTDILLQAGGFRLIVLDMVDVIPELVLRVSLSTWFRFRSVAESGGCCLIVLSQQPCVCNSADLSLALSSSGPGHQSTVLGGIMFSAVTRRQRFKTVGPHHSGQSKPTQSTQTAKWVACSTWTR